MRYWDTSAVVPLFVDEANTRQVRRWLLEDDRVATWAWTVAEANKGDGTSAPFDFVCFGHRLSAAAKFEGLKVLPTLGT